MGSGIQAASAGSADQGQRKKPVRRRAKEPPLLPCRTRSFEHVSLHVELVCLLSASSEGMPATGRTCSVIVLITVQGLLRITNRAGKSGRFCHYTKNNFRSIDRLFARDTQGFFSKKYYPVQRLFHWLRLPNRRSWTPLFFPPRVDFMNSAWLAEAGLMARVHFPI